jgi:uncharacterized protein involved in type VI secretion and phage assembly
MHDLLFGGLGGGNTRRIRDGAMYGVVVGIVTDNCHPEGDFRVRVRFPTLPSSEGDQAMGSSQNKDQSWWARIATFGAGKDGTGLYILPEIDSEVLVAFMNGDFNQPVVVGTLWNGIDKPAYSNTDGSSKTNRYQANDKKFAGSVEAKKNDVRSFSTRKKHELIFNDNASNPGITLSTGQKHRIVLSDAGNAATKIEIVDGKEENSILIDTKNKKVTIETKTGDLLLKAKKTIRLEAEKIETESSKDTAMKVGKNFEMKASSNMTLKSSGQGTVQSSSTMTIKGSTVNIN